MPSRARSTAPQLLLLFACVLGASWFWDSAVLLPLKLLVVFMHESGHALASLVAGGQVDRIVIGLDQSGACLSRLPEGTLRQVFVYSSGYLGSAVAGGTLLFVTYKLQLRRRVLGMACVWLLGMGLIYSGSGLTFVFCLGMAAVLGACAKWLPDGAVDSLNLFLAAFSCLYAVRDLFDDLWTPAVRAHSDAGLLAQLTGIPSLLWAVLWTAASLSIVGTFAVVSLRSRPVPPRTTRALSALR